MNCKLMRIIKCTKGYCDTQKKNPIHTFYRKTSLNLNWWILMRHSFDKLLDRVDTNTDGISQAWEEFNVEIHRCSINAQHAVIRFKVMHGLYYSYSRVSPMCTSDGTLIHVAMSKDRTIWDAYMWISLKSFHS